MKDDRSGWLLGLLAIPLLLICCAGPALLVALLSVGLGTWLAVNGAWILAGVLLVAGVAVAAWWLGRRRAASRVPDQRTRTTPSRLGSYADGNTVGPPTQDASDGRRIPGDEIQIR
jgi:membrane protein implicated in regulation of membrane protease activity